jgi:serine protease inhibitor
MSTASIDNPRTKPPESERARLGRVRVEIVFRADHPFVFYIEHLGSRRILHSQEQTILFIGAVKTPPKYN